MTPEDHRCLGSGQLATAPVAQRGYRVAVCPVCQARVLLVKSSGVLRWHTPGAPASYANRQSRPTVNAAPRRFAGPPIALRCETCCYWFLNRCRRYAPRPIWPRTHALHWCGEWKLPSKFAVTR